VLNGKLPLCLAWKLAAVRKAFDSQVAQAGSAQRDRSAGHATLGLDKRGLGVGPYNQPSSLKSQRGPRCKWPAAWEMT